MQRFIDYIVLCIEQEWHYKLVGRLQERLIEKIPSLSREQLEAMLKEDPEISARRDSITQRIEQLTKIKARLLDYEKEVARNTWVTELQREDEVAVDDDDDASGICLVSSPAL